MQQLFAGEYLSLSTGVFSVRTATLTDDDLIRGDDAGESVAASNGFHLFDGLQQVVFGQGIVTVDDGEAVTTVTFNDGTTLAGVQALYDEQYGPYASLTRQFLLDQSALDAVGKTLADVSNVRIDGLIDHDLSWADFGFTPTGVVVPDPEPEPVLNLVQGTAGADRLTGTVGDDLIRGGDGSDRLTGSAGADTFVFGADARDGNRDRDVITDFNAAEDSIVLEQGVQIRTWTERDGNLIVTIEGDRDTIVIQNADTSILANFSVTDDMFGV